MRVLPRPLWQLHDKLQLSWTAWSESAAVSAATSPDDDNPIADPDAPLSPHQQYKLRKKPDTVTLELPRKGLVKVLTPGATRMHMSTNQLFAYVVDVLRAGKGNISDFAISRSTFHVQCKGTEEELAMKLMESFKSDLDVCYIIVHSL